MNGTASTTKVDKALLAKIADALRPLVPDEPMEHPLRTIFAAEWISKHGGSLGDVE